MKIMNMKDTDDMKRLTEKDTYWIGEEFWTSAKEPDDEEIDNVYMKLKEYEDLEEQGMLLKKEDAVDEGYLYDWYIHSVSDDEPLWTEAHIEELFNDFILIPKEEAEAALAEMEK